MSVVVRQAHPGPSVEPYRSFEHKMEDGRRFKEDEGIPYDVLVDDLIGTVHQVYGGLADPTYLIDADGRVAFYNMWTHAPTLHEAIEELFRQGGRGVVKGGTDRIPHLLSTIAGGWHGLRRGWPQSAVELELSMPGSASGPWLGHQIKPLLAPIALRATPLPLPVKISLAAGAAGLLFLGARALRRAGRSPRARVV